MPAMPCPVGGVLRIATGVVREGGAAGPSHSHAHEAPDPIGGTLEVIVSDTGCGIDPAFQERIFEPFVTTREDGTGLGLSISAEIVRKHGGTITVDSTPGAGSTFTVSLPLFPSQPQSNWDWDDRREPGPGHAQGQVPDG
ncbi:MAG: hypothetical protein HC884_17300 [Chloroflexaceae bacterium]|nr:hypothetical protein [Chloroflexaceae bacterium]